MKKNEMKIVRQHSGRPVLKHEETIHDANSSSSDRRYQPQSPGAAEKRSN